MALADMNDVLNVGAGAGSYEPSGRTRAAVEPSGTMIRQRPAEAAPAVCGVASRLPFPNNAFDASMAVLTVHHWSDQLLGLREMTRVASRRAVILTWDPEFTDFWLLDYFPGILDVDRDIFPTMNDYGNWLNVERIENVPVPYDCLDGFLGAYWRRPHAYLQEEVRSGMSSFAKLRDVGPGLARLRHDLENGQWEHRFGHLRNQESLELGYRLVVVDARSAN